jgi:tyrosyl-tRNA synthetase
LSKEGLESKIFEKKNFNSTEVVNDYISPTEEKRKIKKNLFEKIRPIVQSFKNTQKAKKQTKEAFTSMDEICKILLTLDINQGDDTIQAISEYEQFYNLTPRGLSSNNSKVFMDIKV